MSKKIIEEEQERHFYNFTKEKFLCLIVKRQENINNGKVFRCITVYPLYKKRLKLEISNL